LFQWQCGAHQLHWGDLDDTHQWIEVPFTHALLTRLKLGGPSCVKGRGNKLTMLFFVNGQSENNYKGYNFLKQAKGTKLMDT
jgi:hypothetical protein